MYYYCTFGPTFLVQPFWSNLFGPTFLEKGCFCHTFLKSVNKSLNKIKISLFHIDMNFGLQGSPYNSNEN